VIEKALPSGRTAYYWKPPNRDFQAGFTLRRESLGSDYSAAIARANELNWHFDYWPKGRGADKALNLQPGFGTLEWLVERYKRSRAWEKYRTDRATNASGPLSWSLGTRNGFELGRVSLASISARGIDKLYAAMQKGARFERRLHQANMCMIRMARAWDAVKRLYPTVVSDTNPFEVLSWCTEKARHCRPRAPPRTPFTRRSLPRLRVASAPG